MLPGRKRHHMQLLRITLAQIRILWPYWLFGVVLGSLARVSGIERALALRLTSNGHASGAVARPDDGPGVRGAAGRRRAGLLPIIGGAVAGAISPFSLFGAMPILGTLQRGGVPEAVLAAFLVSSPLINPALFVFSLALGWPLALLRAGAAIVLGSVAGWLIQLATISDRSGDEVGPTAQGRSQSCFQLSLRFEDRPRSRRRGLGPGRPRLARQPWSERSAPERPHDCSWPERPCEGPRPDQSLPRRSLAAFAREFVAAAWFSGRYFVLGMVLAAAVDLWVPKTLLLRVLGDTNPAAILFGASLGVPLYACGGGTIPLLRELLLTGADPGVLMAFMIAGPATKVANLTAIDAIAGRRWLLRYVAFAWFGALVSGYAVHFAWRL